MAIAGALILEPAILILDEPTSELDLIGKDEVFEVVHRLRRERAITVVMVEHAAEQLAEIADRIIVLDAGVLVDQGPPDQLYRNPHLFHRPDAERAPQISEVLFELVRAGLIPEDQFTTREEVGVERLRGLLLAGREVVAEHRSWIHAFLTDLAAEAGLKQPSERAAELQMLYDSVLVSAQTERGAQSARRARRLAQLILRQP